MLFMMREKKSYYNYDIEPPNDLLKIYTKYEARTIFKGLRKGNLNEIIEK